MRRLAMRWRGPVACVLRRRDWPRLRRSPRVAGARVRRCCAAATMTRVRRRERLGAACQRRRAPGLDSRHAARAASAATPTRSWPRTEAVHHATVLDRFGRRRRASRPRCCRAGADATRPRTACWPATSTSGARGDPSLRAPAASRGWPTASRERRSKRVTGRCSPTTPLRPPPRHSDQRLCALGLARPAVRRSPTTAGGSAYAPTPERTAARALRRSKLTAAGVDVGASSGRAGVAPAALRQLAARSASPPLCRPGRAHTNLASDNFFAEMLLKGLGARFGGRRHDAGRGASVGARLRRRRAAISRGSVDGSACRGRTRVAPRASAGCCAVARPARGSTRSPLAAAGRRAGHPRRPHARHRRRRPLPRQDRDPDRRQRAVRLLQRPPRHRSPSRS